MEDIEVVKEIFETAYTEFKEYEAYLNSQIKNIEKGREGFQKFAIENKNNLELIFERMFEVNEKPALQKNDLIKLQNKLIYMYEIVKDVIDIPKEVREEINSLPKPRLSYKIDNGEAVEINKDMNKEIRKHVRENSKDWVNFIIKSNK